MFRVGFIDIIQNYRFHLPLVVGVNLLCLFFSSLNCEFVLFCFWEKKNDTQFFVVVVVGRLQVPSRAIIPHTYKLFSGSFQPNA